MLLVCAIFMLKIEKARHETLLLVISACCVYFNFSIVSAFNPVMS
jgi:hypothetical protein